MNSKGSGCVVQLAVPSASILDSQLAAKGFTKTDSDTADLYVGYQVSISQGKQWNAAQGEF